MTKQIKVIHNPNSLREAEDEAIRQFCRDNGASVTVEAHWQPRLFDEKPDAIVYITSKRG